MNHASINILFVLFKLSSIFNHLIIQCQFSHETLIRCFFLSKYIYWIFSTTRKISEYKFQLTLIIHLSKIINQKEDKCKKNIDHILSLLYINFCLITFASFNVCSNERTYFLILYQRKRRKIFNILTRPDSTQRC